MLEQRPAQRLVGAEQRFGRRAKRRFVRRGRHFGREMPARSAERLVARAPLLTVPYRLVDHRHRGEDRDVLQAEHEVREVGDRAVAVVLTFPHSYRWYAVPFWSGQSARAI